MRKRSKTAAELMADLQRNPEFVARQKAREEEVSKRLEESRLEQGNLLADLKSVGVSAGSVWDLVNTREKYAAAIPVLVRHLSRPYSRRVKEGIVRALTVDYAGDLALCELQRQHQNEADDSELRWVLENAIAIAGRKLGPG